MNGREFPDVVRRFLRATSLGFIWATMEASISEAANLFLVSLSFHQAFFEV
jgi:hypothetical protein